MAEIIRACCYVVFFALIAMSQRAMVRGCLKRNTIRQPRVELVGNMSSNTQLINEKQQIDIEERFICYKNEDYSAIIKITGRGNVTNNQYCIKSVREIKSKWNNQRIKESNFKYTQWRFNTEKDNCYDIYIHMSNKTKLSACDVIESCSQTASNKVRGGVELVYCYAIPNNGKTENDTEPTRQVAVTTRTVTDNVTSTYIHKEDTICKAGKH